MTTTDILSEIIKAGFEFEIENHDYGTCTDDDCLCSSNDDRELTIYLGGECFCATFPSYLSEDGLENAIVKCLITMANALKSRNEE